MSDDEPRRLKHEHATSLELAQALRALARSTDAERLGRVAERLDAVLGGAMQPSAATHEIVASVWPRVIAGVLASGLAVTGLVGWASHVARNGAGDANHSRPRLVLAPLAAAAPVRVTAQHAITAQPALPPSTDIVAADGVGRSLRGDDETPGHADRAPDTAEVRTRGERRSAHHRAALQSSPSNTDSAQRSSSADVPEVAATSRENTEASATAAPASAATAPTPAPAAAKAPPLQEHSYSQRPPAAASPSDAERSEATLLLAARRAPPTAALQLLDEHAALFPDGLLAPEREVLRIEALRRLGRAEEAEQHLRAFQAHYPDSIHLRRLTQSNR